MKAQVRFLGIAVSVLALVGMAGSADAVVTVTPSSDNSPFFPLFRPTGQFDETSLSGFEYLISSRTNQFRANDQYVVAGEETSETASIFNDLGTQSDLAGTEFAFSIQHNLTGGRNFTFAMNEVGNGNSSTLCWGQGCGPGADVSEETINGMAPIIDYNGIQLQVRAQDVAGSSATVQITDLSGVTLSPGSAANFFNETVIPTSPGTISPLDAGRRGQWMMADSNDLTLNEWELTGLVTLFRDDGSTSDLTKVRLAVDLVRDPNLSFVPIPGAVWLFGTGLVALFGVGRWRRSKAA